MPLRRVIGLRELVVYGLLFIAPTGIAGIFGPLYATSNGALVSVYVIATIGMAFTAGSYIQMSRAVPKAGSVFAYATAGIGPRVGFVAGWMMLLDYLLIPSVAYLFAGLALHSAVPSVPAWLFTAVAVIGTTACNMKGVRFAAWVGFVVLGIDIVILMLVTAAGLAVVAIHGSPHSWAMPVVGDNGLTFGALAAAASLAVFSFLGFDGIATFAEENSGDAKVVGRATFISLVLSAAILLVVGYISALLEPMTPSAMAANPVAQDTAFYDAIRTSIAPWLSTLFAACKALGSAFAAMVGQAAASRLLYGMAREHRLPAFFAAIGKRSGVPIRSTWLLGTLTLAVATVAAWRSNGLSVLSTTVNAGALTGFLAVNVAVVGYFTVRSGSRRRVIHLFFPVFGAVVSLALLLSTSTTAKIVGGCWLVAGVVAAIVQDRRAKNQPVRVTVDR